MDQNERKTGNSIFRKENTQTIDLDLERQNTTKIAPKICEYEHDLNVEEIVLDLIEVQQVNSRRVY